MGIKLRLLLAILLATLGMLATPTEARAVIMNLNGQTGQTQTFQNDQNVTISSANNIHSLIWQGLLPISRGGTGAGTFTSGSIPFIFSGVFSQDTSNFFWDSTNKRLGIGTSSPTSTLEVVGDAIIHSLNIGLGGGANANNTSLGYQALSSNTTGFSNTAAGYGALQSNTTGSLNTAYGFKPLHLNTTGQVNTAFGYEALRNNVVGNSNTAVGTRALFNTLSGSNTAVGGGAFFAHQTGEGNVVIGSNTASSLVNVGQSVYIGNEAGGQENNFNSIVIGASAQGIGSNTAVIGNSNMTDVYFGSSNANANIHTKKLFLGSSTTPGCIIMGDTAGGVGYITLNNGVLTASPTPPAACQ